MLSYPFIYKYTSENYVRKGGNQYYAAQESKFSQLQRNFLHMTISKYHSPLEQKKYDSPSSRYSLRESIVLIAQNMDINSK